MNRPDPDHVAFGLELVKSREARSLTREEVAKTTKIPERTLACLEEGRYGDLPADVFVKGFLKSYARATGLDPAETITKWESSRRPSALPASAPASVSSPPAPAPVAAVAAPTPSPSAVPPPSTPPADTPRPHALDHIHGITRALANLGHGARRMPLTLAVIILVIVATLTVSLLLRRPDTRPRGGGISQLAPAPRPAAPSRA